MRRNSWFARLGLIAIISLSLPAIALAKHGHKGNHHGHHGQDGGDDEGGGGGGVQQ